MIEVAIVGGGPAGAYCAYCLAENGIYTVIFDHSHPREKPCAGIISPIAQDLFPFLKKLPIEHTRRKTVYFISPSGRKVPITIRNSEIICLSRLKFDQFLLNMALSRGAKLIKEKVIDLKKWRQFWKIKTTRGVYVAKKLVGADGVNSIVRAKATTPLKGTDKGVCYGYFIKGLDNEDIVLYFLPHRKGYIWVSPRINVSSVGIGCAEISRAKGIRGELDAFINRHYPNIKIISRWAALIPNIKDKKTLNVPIAGKTWILIGDAAGHVNPISGEGILYALLGGELAAQAISENDMLTFEKLWREAYGLNLQLCIELKNWIYKKPITELFCEYLRIKSIVGF